jgi:hypothetical protein
VFFYYTHHKKGISFEWNALILIIIQYKVFCEGGKPEAGRRKLQKRERITGTHFH